MSFGNKLTTKGFVAQALTLATKGWLYVRSAFGPEPYPPPTYCDYPHAVKMATSGRLGAVVGTISRGVVLRVCIEEFPIPTERRTGPALRGFRKREDQKLVKVTVWAYGKKFVHEKVIAKDKTVKMRNLEITDLGNKEIKIEIKGIKKK